MPNGNVVSHAMRSRALLLIVLAGMLAPLRMFAAFGLGDEAKVFVVDSGAGLVFKVDKANGNIVSIRYKGGAELQESKKGSHIASGFGHATVTGTVIGGNLIKITIATDANSGVAKSLTHYLIVRKGLNNIYMATYPTAEPSVGELRWITRLESSRFPNSPEPSNNRGTVKAIESKDVFGNADGTTRSKYYGDAKTHGKDRAMDMTFCGVSGNGVGVWMVYGTRESSSGGPFHRDIQNQSTEVYNYMNSGHNMTEPPRLNVLHGPYALVFTDGQPPALPLDTSWIDTARLDLTGYVPASQRGSVSGVATGIPPGLQGVVGFSNATAQYWAVVATNGAYTSPLMKPGAYDAQLYQGELAVGSGTVTVSAGAKTKLDLAAKPFPAAIFKIGEWDGTPAGFLNGDKIVTMHPSDSRMSAWAPVTFTVGVDPVGKFPALQLRKVNSPTIIKFHLAKDQIANHVLRIGITCAYAGGRPGIKVNAWSPAKIPDGSNQPKSRSFTIGTYRGNNALFTYTIPSSAFVAGENTLTISPVSGNSDLGPWLSAGWAYDAIQLDAAPAMR
jgi:rhamnogalacturonan endolyase